MLGDSSGFSKDAYYWECPFCGRDDFPELTEVYYISNRHAKRPHEQPMAIVVQSSGFSKDTYYWEYPTVCDRDDFLELTEVYCISNIHAKRPHIWPCYLRPCNIHADLLLQNYSIVCFDCDKRTHELPCKGHQFFYRTPIIFVLNFRLFLLLDYIHMVCSTVQDLAVDFWPSGSGTFFIGSGSFL